ncbi:MAG: hypothetical protein ACTSQ4_02670 [Candidatus Heimdallarchaeaceae archaeon]
MPPNLWNKVKLVKTKEDLRRFIDSLRIIASNEKSEGDNKNNIKLK